MNRFPSSAPAGPQRTRFTPSATSELHLGSARTALFSWLVARSSGGAFVVRIDDTDAAHIAQDAEASILGDLAWLGLNWDEGPDVGGDFGPYRESERIGRYKSARQQLAGSGLAYPCFCTPEILEADAAADAAEGRPPRYCGRCRGLSAEERDRRLAAGESASWRFAVPPGREIAIEDEVFGKVVTPPDALDDFVIVLSDGTATAELADPVDDGAMGITMIVRGVDHLPSAPRNALIAEALGSTQPRFAHLPLVTDQKGEPLSAEEGAEGIGRFRGAGFLPEAILDHLVHLGWSDARSREMLTRNEMIASFDLSRVSTAPAIHDPARLLHLNGVHLRALSAEDRAAFLTPWAADAPSWVDRTKFIAAASKEVVVGADVRGLMASLVHPLPLDEEALEALAQPGASGALALAYEVLQSSEATDDGAMVLRFYRDRTAGTGRIPPDVAIPALRVALTGRARGLPLEDILSLLGSERASGRVRAALTLYSGRADS